MRRILVAGGAGFIGSNFVRMALAKGAQIVTVDALTYAGDLANLAGVPEGDSHHFIHASINDRRRMRQLLADYRPAAIVNFAAESHVDRSIDDPAAFIDTNINGTFALLQSAQSYWEDLTRKDRASFRLLHVSTDEVYGTVSSGRSCESSPYAPNSPYAASKAAADHLVRAYNRTYGLPTLITNCGNNYGPRQFPEKLIPHMIATALAGGPLPIYGDGRHVRDWLYVEDHCQALMAVLQGGRIGETYNIGNHSERTNLEVVEALCAVLDQLQPRPGRRLYSELITFVADRPGHDRRYALDAGKIAHDLGWRAAVSFEDGLRRTVRWYLQNRAWWEDIRSGAYQGERLGLRQRASVA